MSARPPAGFVIGLLSAFLVVGEGAAETDAKPAAAEEEKKDSEPPESGVTLFEGGGFKLDFTLEAGLSGQWARNANFGAGSSAVRGRTRGNRDWFEGFLKPGLSLEIDLGDFGTAYGQASAAAAATRGLGDAQAASGTFHRPEYLTHETAFVGWRSADLLPAPGGDAVDLSFGQQNFLVGDGFLVIDGTVDGVGRAAYYLGPRAAFEETAILRINTAPVRADLFHIRTPVDQKKMRLGDQADMKLVGVNVEWFESSEKDLGRSDYEKRKWYVGATYLRGYDADGSGSANFSFAQGGNGTAVSANRDGLDVYALRFGGAFLPFLEDFGFYGEGALQRNHSTNRKVRAEAWYLEPQYTFGDLPLKPRLSYRYSRFSGDGKPGDATDRSWDPLFGNTGPRGIGTWAQGEIYSQYVGANTNLEAHQVHLKAAAVDDVLDVGLVYYRFNFDKPSQTAGVRDDHLMDELNVYAQWTTPVRNLVVLGAFGVGFPGAGARESLGLNSREDRNIYLYELIANYRF
jgi:hypothetical protein